MYVAPSRDTGHPQESFRALCTVLPCPDIVISFLVLDIHYSICVFVCLFVRSAVLAVEWKRPGSRDMWRKWAIIQNHTVPSELPDDPPSSGRRVPGERGALWLWSETPFDLFYSLLQWWTQGYVYLYFVYVYYVYVYWQYMYYIGIVCMCMFIVLYVLVICPSCLLPRVALQCRMVA